MKVLNEKEMLEVNGGKNFFKSVINVVSVSLITGVVEGVAGFAVAGPAGFVVGFGHGAFEGATGAVIYEGAMGATETMHPQLGVE